MIKVFTIKLPYHAIGRSYRLDFPISGNERYVTGAFAVANVYADEQPEEDRMNWSTPPMVLGKVSLSSDGRVVTPSIPLLTRISVHESSSPTNVYKITTARKLMRAVDFGRLGNKLSIIVEEFPDTVMMSGDYLKLTYTVKVYLKTIKKIC